MDRVEQLQGLPSGILWTKGTKWHCPGTRGNWSVQEQLETPRSLPCFVKALRYILVQYMAQSR